MKKLKFEPGFVKFGMNRAVTALVIIATSSLLLINPASAQTTPANYLFNSYPSQAYPPTAPYESTAPDGIVVEGLYPCEGSYYSISSVEQWTVHWANAGDDTVTEISAYASCQTLSAYESELNQITKYVEANATNPGKYWGGLMIDEEGGYGFSASQLETLNLYIQNIMSSTTGLSWYFTEIEPNSWNTATYNTILESSWADPESYSTSTIGDVNAECTTYGMCTNMVEVDTEFAYPYDDYAYVTGQVNGTAWTNSYWGGAYWANLWRS